MRVSRLLGRIAQLDPRVVLMVAGPGWGKTSLARQLLGQASSPSYCDLRDVLDAADAQRVLSEAYGDRIAAGRAPDMLVVDELSALDRVGWGPFEKLMRELAFDVRLILLAQRRPAVDLSAFAAPHEVLTLLRSDLAFTETDTIEMFAENGVGETEARLARNVSIGWPVSTLMLLRLAREGMMTESLSDLTGARFADLHQYIKARVIDRLDRDTHDAMVTLAALGEATIAELSALSEPAAARAFEQLIDDGAAFLTRDGSHYALTSFVRATVLAKHERGVRNVRLAAVEHFMARSAFMRAVRIASAGRNWELAVSALERIFSDPASITPDAREALRSVPVDALVYAPALFVEYLCDGGIRSDPPALLRRLRQAATSSRVAATDPVVRYALDVAMYSALWLANANFDAADLETKIEDMQVPPGAEPLAAFFEGERAVLRSSLGKLDDARSLFEAMKSSAEPAPGQRFALSFNAHLYAGHVDALIESSEEHLRRTRLFGDRSATHRALAYRAVALFFAGDRAAFLAAVRRAIDVDPNRRNPGRFTDPADHPEHYPLHLNVLCAIDAAFDATDARVAAALLDDLIPRVDGAGKPIWSALVRVARARIPGANRRALLSEALAIVQGTQAQALIADVRALMADEIPTGPFARIMRSIDESTLLRGARSIRVSIVDGTVNRGEAVLPVRAREFEILALLALHGVPLTIAQICDLVWPQAHEEAVLSALRMSVHRLRKQIGDANAVARVPQGYCIGSDVSCDVVEAERTVAAYRRLSHLGSHERDGLRELFAIFAAPKLAVGERFAWYDRIETRLAAVRHGLGVVLGRDALDQGDPAGAIDLAEAMLAVDDYDEPAVELLVRALAAAGERAEAIRRFRQYADRLKLDYGVDATVELAPLLEERRAG